MNKSTSCGEWGLDEDTPSFITGARKFLEEHPEVLDYWHKLGEMYPPPLTIGDIMFPKDNVRIRQETVISLGSTGNQLRVIVFPKRFGGEFSGGIYRVVLESEDNYFDARVLDKDSILYKFAEYVMKYLEAK